MVAETNAEYSTKAYWEKRYSNNEIYDWLKGYSEFAPFLLKNIDKSDRILILGCGNSSLGEEMYDAGFHNIVNIDYAENVVEFMRERNKGRPLMKWITMDILDMQFADESFDIAIDKATMDAFMTESQSSWNPPASVVEKVDREVSQVSKLLKSGGKFIYFTFGQPHFRRPFLDKPAYGWSIDIETYGEAFHYFVYIMKKF